ncbi:nitroreductase [Pseudomonas sp. 58(2021)]|uniref:nitroreductase family protein n=1 Tax=Pseudomonas sp. 58(2021) TaxID=2813330 RepID=UPI001A9D8F69|nr:nitroreductase [Pseudomonas sp. 58(2021)]
MNIDQAISGRHSTREYTTQAVDEEVIVRLIHAASLAPSAMNRQPWRFTVVRDQALLDRISREAKACMLETLDRGTQSERFHALLNDEHFQIFYHAPVLILISADAPGQWVVEDCALAAQNLMLSACAEGLGTCWIGFAQRYLNTPQGKQALKLAQAWVAVAPIIVGHPKHAPAPVAHQAPDIHWVG